MPILAQNHGIALLKNWKFFHYVKMAFLWSKKPFFLPLAHNKTIYLYRGYRGLQGVTRGYRGLQGFTGERESSKWFGKKKPKFLLVRMRENEKHSFGYLLFLETLF